MWRAAPSIEMLSFLDFYLLGASENRVASSQEPECGRSWPRSLLISLSADMSHWFLCVQSLSRQQLVAVSSWTWGALMCSICASVTPELEERWPEAGILLLEVVGFILFCFHLTEYEGWEAWIWEYQAFFNIQMKKKKKQAIAFKPGTQNPIKVIWP